MFTTRKNDKSHLNFANYLLYLGMEWLKYSKASYVEGGRITWSTGQLVDRAVGRHR